MIINKTLFLASIAHPTKEQLVGKKVNRLMIRF